MKYALRPTPDAAPWPAGPRAAGTRLGRLFHVWRILLLRFLRRDAFAMLLFAALSGAAVGAGVVALRELVVLVHGITFGVTLEGHPDLAGSVAGWRALVVPALGGLLFGIGAALLRKLWPREVVDAVEANALHGGRMSLGDSVRLAVLTVGSLGIGASVGIEAAVTQLGAGLCSWLGQHLGLRRADLRTMVGCGAAAAIAAAYNAPLAGAFYAFELVVGGWSRTALAPVVIAAITGTLTAESVFGATPVFVAGDTMTAAGAEYLAFAAMGVAAAGLGIVVMRGVTLVERVFRSQAIPRWLRPALGGSALGLLALAFPQVLGSGHGAIDATVNGRFPLPLLLALIVVKALGSALSIGCGFRGGMFSASLFLGSLLGAVCGIAATRLLPGLPADVTLYTLVGMGAVGAAVVGAPITMILLVLETTSDYEATMAVAVGVMVAAVCARRWFGYSFATWRFHLRGIAVRGGHDVGRLLDLKVATAMRRDVLAVPAWTDLATLQRMFLMTPARIVFLTDQDGSLAGAVTPAEASAAEFDEWAAEIPASSLLSGPPVAVTSGESLRAALDLFEAAQVETMAVVDEADHRHLVGCLHETDALRRYNEVLERLRAEELDAGDLFGAPRRSGTAP